MLHVVEWHYSSTVHKQHLLVAVRISLFKQMQLNHEYRQCTFVFWKEGPEPRFDD